MPSGTAPSGAAGRAGTSNARRCARRCSGEHFDIHGGGMRPRLSAPRERDRAERGRQREQAASRTSGCTTASSTSTTRRCRSRSATSSPSATCWQRYDGETLRFFFLRAHYRSPLNFSRREPRRRAQRAAPPLHGARRRAGARRRRRSTGRSRRRPRFRAAMNDDFGTPEAVAVLFELAGEVNRTRFGARRLRCSRAWARRSACCTQSPRAFLQGRRGTSTRRRSRAHRERAPPPRRRATSRSPTRSATSCAAQGVELKDSAQGTVWVKA